ncbi:hypothetical protein D3C84_789410 [compost metagenome]
MHLMGSRFPEQRARHRANGPHRQHLAGTDASCSSVLPAYVQGMGPDCLSIRVQVRSNLRLVRSRSSDLHAILPAHVAVNRARSHFGSLHVDLPQLLDRRRRALDDGIALAVLGELCLQHAAVRLSHSD